MTTSSTATHLVMAGSGKTGRRVVRLLTERGHQARAAARSNTATRFDWDEPATWPSALAGVDRVYLVPPAVSVDFADQVIRFLGSAAAVGVEHVTYLSAHGVEYAPAEVALRAVELELQAQGSFTYSILRPAWFMENFTEGFLVSGILSDRQIVGPAGDGAEAFISAEDVAGVAVATLSEPAAHAGESYSLTGPDALSFTDAAGLIGEVIGERVSYRDLGRDQWLAATIAAGVPADFAAMLTGLFDTIRSGRGAATTSTVHEVLQRDPIDFRSFVHRHRDAWQTAGALS